jgi:hypothetical protein
MKLISWTMKFVVFTAVSTVIFAAANFNIYAGQDKKNRVNLKQADLWRQVEASNVKKHGEVAVRPEKYLIFRLNQTLLRDALADLTLKNVEAESNKTFVMEVPMPDGTIQRFGVEDAPVLSPELAARFPTWKTFKGFGIDDPTASARFDWNALGFHGYIESSKGTIYIDPYQKGDTENYLVFYKHEFGASDNEFFCRVENQMSKIIESNSEFAFLPSTPSAFSFGTAVRTYRIAVATTGEWSRNAAGFTEGMPANTIRTNALAVVTTTVNRLNGIYIRELASTFQLVNPPVDNDATNIIFDDPATDPYDNSDKTAQLTINQTTVDARVGAANYDVGHLYGTGGGGVASSPSLCSNAKAEGYSARGTNTGDPFTVDYVAHELGHQFGANHTYNNSDPDGACTTRSAENAFEVASGSTIMSYVGICSQRNLQQFVDTGFSSFHIRSLTEISNNLATGDPQTTGCGLAAGTNNIPSLNAGNTFNVPKLTPFTLTATGGDADAGDVANLLYAWEEYDLAPSPSGSKGTPANTFDVDTDGVLRPLFRSYSPISGNTRTFPSPAFILNPANNDPAGSNQPPLTYTGTHPTGFPGAVCEPSITCVVGERLPTVNRTMNFRVSVRDRRGGVRDEGTTVVVNAAAGPFQVTAQNTAAVWGVGSTQIVTWDVANTTSAPINTANVNILLSTDGGQTFPITLAGNTPNDGSEPITVPNNPTTAARIKIEAVGNIYFDINNSNFEIVPNFVDLEATINISPDPVFSGNNLTYQITVTNKGNADADRIFLYQSDSFQEREPKLAVVSMNAPNGFVCRIANANDPPGTEVACRGATVAGGQTVRFTIVKQQQTALQRGVVINHETTVRSDATEQNTANNRATGSTTVR